VPLLVSPQGDTLAVSTTRPGSALTARTWLALVAMGLGVFVIANDFTALSVAIPRIEQDLHTTLSRAQWVINGYALLFGVLIVTGGRLADLLGRKRFLLAERRLGDRALVPGMCVLGVGVGLFYSAVTTAAVTALDPDQSSLAGGIVYMCQIAGGAIGLGLNTAIVLSAATLRHGITVAFRVDAALAVGGLVVALAYVRGPRTSAAHAAAPLAHHRVRA